MLYIETPRPNTNRHVHAHKCLHCAEIEPATSTTVSTIDLVLIDQQSVGKR
jgi:hypothetical protein